MSSVLVNVSEDADLRLISLLSQNADDSFEETCTSCITGGDTEKLVRTIVSSAPAMQSFLSLDTEEAVAVISLLASLLQKSDDSNAVMELVDAIIEQSEGKDVESTERTLTLVSVFYNMLNEKIAILNRLFTLAGRHATVLLQPETTLGRLLSSPNTATFATGPSVPPLVTLLDAWQTPAPDRRILYSTICQVLQDSRRQRFYLLLVETYTDKNDLDEMARTAATEAALGAIRDPVTWFRHQRNLLTRPAIQALQDTSLLELLKIFQEGKLSDYEAFGQDVSKWGLNASACQRHMRILSLCSLAAEHEEIPYSDIAQTLQLDGTGQVETWVIAAVNSGLLQAKMDQLTQNVMVERCVVRQFEMEQWKDLQIRLAVWKKNVGSILETLKQSQTAIAPTNGSS